MNKYDKKALIFFSILYLFFVVLVFVGALSHIRHGIEDNLEGGKKPLDNIVIIKIDDDSINKIGRWPWNREVFAELLNKTNDAKAIGIDVSFFESSINDGNLNATLKEMNNVILAAEINGDKLYKPIFEAEFGYVNLKTDDDGITRKVETSISNEYKPFAFKIYEKSRNKEVSANLGRYKINFVGNPGSFNSISLFDVLQNNLNFENKIVLVGATAPDLHDNYFVPTSEGIPMPGVEIHANILQNLILDDFVKEQNRAITAFLILVLGFLCTFVVSRMKIYYVIPIVVAFIIVNTLIGIYVFSKFNYLIDLFFVPLAAIIFTGAGVGLNYLEEKKQNTYITNAFGKYVSKDLLNEIISKRHELKLGGTKRNVTIFFSDIRGFTSISEKLSPEELVSFVNEYLTDMTKIIMKYSGTVDKFIGDAIMAFWNAPLDEKDHAELACKSAVEQYKKLEELKKKFANRNLPHIEIGCGINTGDAIIGNVGSEDRFDYTALGDNVNLASRLESLTKLYGVDIIISESTYGIVKDKFKCRKLDNVKVKGKKIPITIYELCVDYDENFVGQFEKALELYFDSKFSLAKKEFEKTLKMKTEDESCKLFIDRCAEYIKSPPEKDWGGAFEMTHK